MGPQESVHTLSNKSIGSVRLETQLMTRACIYVTSLRFHKKFYFWVNIRQSGCKRDWRIAECRLDGAFPRSDLCDELHTGEMHFSVMIVIVTCKLAMMNTEMARPSDPPDACLAACLVTCI